uniref:Uncharacterized protein n=1 Tax=Rhizophora mucronata TaxID=61149 RepID=A0A2P2J7M7_RHIMU
MEARLSTQILAQKVMNFDDQATLSESEIKYSVK